MKRELQARPVLWEKVSSEVDTADPPCKPNIRQAEAMCVTCGETALCRGLNAYATVQHKFSTKNGSYGYTRFLGISRVRFCHRCVNDDEILAKQSKIVRLSQKAFIIFGLMTIPAILLIRQGEQAAAGACGLLLIIIAAFGLLLTLIFYLPANKGLSDRNIYEFIKYKVASYLDESREQWGQSFDLAGFDLAPNYTDLGAVASGKEYTHGIGWARPENVIFYIEPDDLETMAKYGRGLAKDGSGTIWRDDFQI